MCFNKVVPQLMAMAQGGMEEKWNTAQVTTFKRFKSFKEYEVTVSYIYNCTCDQDFAGDGWEAGWGGGYGGSFGRGGPGGR